MLVGFRQDLEHISGQTSGDVAVRYLREWLRLCFLDNNYRSIRAWIKQCSNPAADFYVSFATFYDVNALTRACKNIMEHYGLLKESLDIIPDLHARFLSNNPDRDYGQDYADIERCLSQLRDKNIKEIDILTQARIDHYLVKTHGVDPLLRDEYFDTLTEIYQTYGLAQ